MPHIPPRSASLPPIKGSSMPLHYIFMPTLCKGGWHTAGVPGDCLCHTADLKILLHDRFTIPQSLRDSSLYTREPSLKFVIFNSSLWNCAAGPHMGAL